MKIRRQLILALFATSLLACGPQAPEPKLPVPQAPVDPVLAVNKLMELTLPDLTGQPQAIKQWRGKILVVNYWATWCAPCRAEMPAFSALHEKFSAKGVQFVGISIDSVEKIKEFAKETPVSYPLLIAGDEVGQTAADLGNTMRALPFTVIIDRDGRLHGAKLGRYSEEALEKELRSLLAR